MVQFHASTHAQVNPQVNEKFNTFKFLTDDEFAEETKEEDVEAAQGQSTEPKKPFQMKPLPPPKPPHKHIYMYIYSNVTIACWFTLQSRCTSVCFITGPVPGTSGVDDQDVIDVMDPVRVIAKQALADLCRKENQRGVIPEGKKIIDMAVDVLKNLPKQDMQLTKSELHKTAADTGIL